jgi:hypothetical protein
MIKLVTINNVTVALFFIISKSTKLVKSTWFNPLPVLLKSITHYNSHQFQKVFPIRMFKLLYFQLKEFISGLFLWEFVWTLIALLLFSQT